MSTTYYVAAHKCFDTADDQYLTIGDDLTSDIREAGLFQSPASVLTRVIFLGTTISERERNPFQHLMGHNIDWRILKVQHRPSYEILGEVDGA